VGTLGILKALLLNIQGEANPIYVVERHRNTWFDRGPGCALVLGLPLTLMVTLGLLIFGVTPALSSSKQQFGPLWSGEAIEGICILAVCYLISLAWTFLPATLAGQIIRRERAAQTWDLLLMTPYPTQVILIAKAAASTRDISASVLSAAGMIAMLRIGLTVAMLYLIQSSNVVKALVVILCIIVIVVEPLQETALAVIFGVNTAIIGDSSWLSTLYGAVGGLFIRLTQIIIVLLLMPLLQAGLPAYITSVNAAIIGTPALLLTAPTITSALLVIMVIVGREALIRALFAWTVRRAHEG